MGQFLGQSIDKKVTEQLNLRSQFLKDGVFTGGGNSLLHGNAAFISLYSSVEGSGFPADFWMLDGGLAFKDDYANTPKGYSAKSTGDGRGFTPRPGITGAQIKTKGTFGTLRDVEVTIKAFNRDDFNIIYELYCRPGFSFLLEWGHTVYSTAKGNVQTVKQTARQAFFSSGATYKSVQAAITNCRSVAKYNYDGMLAICKNFSWSFNADGSYDVTLSLISKGEVIESIKSSFDPGFTEKDVAALQKGNLDKSERKSPLHYFGKRLELNSQKGEFAGDACIGALKNTTPGFAGVLTPSELEVWCAPGFDIKQPDSFFDKDTVFVYMSLRTICSVLNSAGIMHEGKGQRSINLKTTAGNKYFTHDQHFSINPFVCVVPNLNGPTNGLCESKPAEAELHKSITAYYAATGGTKPPADDVLSICVSNLYLYEKLDAIYDSDQESENEPGLLDIFKSILGGINEALGGVNELDLAYDEELNEWSIVDRKCKIPPASQKGNVTELDLIGLGSFAYDFKTESKITNKLASQISIAAQASGTGTKQDVKEMLQWNRGHSDRIFPIKEDPSPKTAAEIKQAATEAAAARAAEKAKAEEDLKTLGEWRDRVTEAFDKFNGGLFEDQQYDPDLFKGLLSGHQTYQSKLATAACQSENIPPPGTIPVELSFKLHGVSGFKIGETFKLAANTVKVLPTAYSNETVGFIVMKVDHTVGDNGWTTEVGALMYNLEKLSGDSSALLKGAGSATAGSVVKQETPPANEDGSPSTEGGTDKLRNQTALGTNVKYDNVKTAVQKKGYTWFAGELELNIVGVRNTSGQMAANPKGRGVLHPITNKFKDIVIVAWIENGQQFAESYPATTVPGAGWTLAENAKFKAQKAKDAKNDKNSWNPNGTGTMFEKQFLNQYGVGKHSSHSAKPHPALVSLKQQTAHRDKEYKDNWIDLAVTPHGKHGTTAGLFEDGTAMQIHNSGEYGEAATKNVDNWSAGCQVFADASQHRRLMELVGKSQKKTKRSSFSYSLLNDKDIKL